MHGKDWDESGDAEDGEDERKYDASIKIASSEEWINGGRVAGEARQLLTTIATNKT
jgi:hypothetical protein